MTKEKAPLKNSSRNYYSIHNLKDEWRLSPDSSGDGKIAGIDGITPKNFSKNLEYNLGIIRNDIKLKEFKFCPLKFIPIDKEGGKKRIICVPTVRDRLVQRLILRIISKDKRKEKQYLHNKIGIEKNIHVYGLDHNTKVHKAIEKAIELRDKNQWVFKTDIEAFFDNIDRQQLTKMVCKIFQKLSLTDLIIKVINCDFKFTAGNRKELIKANANHIEKGKGIRQGMPLSSFLSNLFLKDFDKAAYKKFGDNIIRYADDIIVFLPSKEKCIDAEDFIRKELQKIKQTIPSLSNITDKGKTKIAAPAEAIIFLGIEIFKSGNNYNQRISDAQTGKMKKEFTNESSFQYAIKEKLNYPELLKRRDQKILGYKSYYRHTKNIDCVIAKLQKIKQDSSTEILSNILGKEVLDKLSKQQKEFLGICNLL
jgi:retron-type reverse transcriptase